jgi:hypothetical protein
LRDGDRDFDEETRAVFTKVEKWIHENNARAGARLRKAIEKRQRELRARHQWEQERDERKLKREARGRAGMSGGMPNGMPTGPGGASGMPGKLSQLTTLNNVS